MSWKLYHKWYIVTGYSLSKALHRLALWVTLIEVVFSLESVFLGYKNCKNAINSISFFSAHEQAELNKCCNTRRGKIYSWFSRDVTKN